MAVRHRLKKASHNQLIALDQPLIPLMTHSYSLHSSFMEVQIINTVFIEKEMNLQKDVGLVWYYSQLTPTPHFYEDCINSVYSSISYTLWCRDYLQWDISMQFFLWMIYVVLVLLFMICSKADYFLPWSDRSVQTIMWPVELL